MRAAPASALLLVLWALAAVPAASATPVITPGWPVVGPAGTVLPGPDRGVFVSGLSGGALTVSRVFDRSGRALWSRSRFVNCGSCDGGWRPALRADGNYGPIGLTGEAPWALTPAGDEIDACLGIALADSSCVEQVSDRQPEDGYTFPTPGAVVGSHNGAAWKFADRLLALPVDYLDDPPRVVRDARGRIYTAMQPVPETGGTTASGSLTLVALSPSGAELWRRADAGAPLAALHDGVVVNEAGVLRVLDPDGAVRWSRDVGTRHGTIHADPRRGVFYAVLPRFRGVAVLALSLDDGAIRWRSSAHRFGSIGRAGIVYLRDLRGVRAVGPDGRLRWRFRTTGPPSSVAEMHDRTVVVAVANPRDDRLAGPYDALLYRLQPRLRAPRPARDRVYLSRRRVAVGCTVTGIFDSRKPPCERADRAGTLLHLNLRRAARVTVSYRTASGANALRSPTAPVRAIAPAGRSALRLLTGGTTASAGRYRVVVSLRGRNWGSNRAFWIRVVD